MKRVLVYGMGILAVIFLFSGCVSSSDRNAYSGRYVHTRVNLRYNASRDTGSYIGYTRLQLIPVNTRVKILKVMENGFLAELPSGEEVLFVYRDEWGAAGGAPIETAMSRIFSKSDVSRELIKYNEIERKGIEDGAVYPGMGKQAVVVAMGFPPAHRTPSIRGDRWIYWNSRFSEYYVKFSNNRVVDASSFKLW